MNRLCRSFGLLYTFRVIEMSLCTAIVGIMFDRAGGLFVGQVHGGDLNTAVNSFFNDGTNVMYDS